MKKSVNRGCVCVVFLFLFLLSASNGASAQNATSSHKSSANADHHTIFSYKIINADSSTFGYDIYRNDQLLIHQKSVPAFPGNKGFKTKANAEKTARLVIEKLRAGEMPPTVTVEELKNMKVIE